MDKLGITRKKFVYKLLINSILRLKNNNYCVLFVNIYVKVNIMSVIIKDIQRNSSEIIRIEISEFKGKELINLRIWYQTLENGEVVYKPTQKGVALSIEKFDELKEAVIKIEEYLHDRNFKTTQKVE